MAQDTVILKIGVEGGSITVTGSRSGDGWRFAVHVRDSTPDLLDEPVEPRPPKMVASWGDLLEILDRYPWARLFPMEVHPEFRRAVLEAVVQRLSTPDERGFRALNRWKEACGA
jgi:hypothetical protein